MIFSPLNNAKVCLSQTTKNLQETSCRSLFVLSPLKDDDLGCFLVSPNESLGERKNQKLNI